ncbi:MAG: lysoplasmalogenase [bacterium]|nr:lysoplasmalogenase [bacterium]
MFTAIIAASVCGMLAAGYFRVPGVMGRLRLVASTSFVLVAVAGGAHRTGYGRLVLGALVGCWFGDYLLDRGAFAPGVIAFLTGHVLFIAAFVVRGISFKKWAIATAIVLLPESTGIYLWFFAHIPPEHRLVVLAYVAVITIMVALAWGTHGARRNALIPAGAVLFYLSDILVGVQAFFDVSRVASAVCAPLYHAAVVLLALSAYDRGRRTEALPRGR